MINISNEYFIIKDGEKICQMIIAKHVHVTWEEFKILKKQKEGLEVLGIMEINKK